MTTSNAVLEFHGKHSTGEHADVYPLKEGSFQLSSACCPLTKESVYELDVFFRGQKVTAYNECERYADLGIHENTAYFKNIGQIWKATFIPPKSIIYSPVRNLTQGEETHHGGLVSQVRDGQKYVYRMCDHPSDGIALGFDYKELRGFTFEGIHRGKLICSHVNQFPQPSVRIVKDDVIVVEIPGLPGWSKFCSFGRDYLRHFYIPTKQGLCTLDTENSTLLPYLEFRLSATYTDHVIDMNMCMQRAWCVIDEGGMIGVAVREWPKKRTRERTCKHSLHAAQLADGYYALETTEMRVQRVTGQLKEEIGELRNENTDLKNAVNDIERKYRKLLMMTLGVEK